MLDTLMKNSLPINDKNFKALFDSFNLFDANELEKALFAIKNNMNLTQSLANQIDSAIAKDNNLTMQLDSLLNSILNSDNPDTLLNSIFKNTDASELLNNSNFNLNSFKEELASLIGKNPSLLDNINNAVLDKMLNNSNSELSLNFSDSQSQSQIDKLLNFLFPKESLTNNNLFNLLNNFNNSLNNNFNNNNNLEENLEKNLDNFFKSVISSLKKQGLDTSSINNKDISNLQKELLSLANQDSSIAKNLLELFQNGTALHNLLKNKFSFDFKGSSQEDMNVFFKELTSLTSTLKHYLDNQDNQDNKDGSNANLSGNNINSSGLNELSKTIDFMNAIKDAFYLQIPVNINDFNTTAELFVFKDGQNSKGTSSGKKSASALVAINLLNLGNIEVFLNKIENDIYFQFRLEEDFVEDLIRSNQAMLETYLQVKNLKLKDIKFTKLEESFSIIANEYEEFRQYESIDIAT